MPAYSRIAEKANGESFSAAARAIVEPLREVNHAQREAERLEYGFNDSAEPERTANEQQAEEPEATVERFPVVSMSELMTTKYATEYLIHNVLVKGGFAVMVAPLKGMKTSVALLLSICLCVGCRLFGLFEVPQTRRVGYMSGEADPATLQDTIRRICASMRIDPARIENFFPTFSVPRLDIEADIAAVERFITDHRLEVLFCDCFYLTLGAFADKASNLFAMGGLLRRLLEIQIRTGCTFCVLHHMPKHTACGEPSLDQAAFAGIAECARQWILMNRMEVFDPSEPEMRHRLWFVSGGSAGHCTSVALDINEGRHDDPGGRSWSLSATWGHQARQEMVETEQDRRDAVIEQRVSAQMERDRQKVLNAIRKYPDGETKRTIKAEAVLPQKRFDDALAAVLESGEAEPCEIIKNKRHETGYRARWGTVGNGEKSPPVPGVPRRGEESPLNRGASPPPEGSDSTGKGF